MVSSDRVFVPDFDRKVIEVTAVNLKEIRFELLKKFEKFKLLNNGFPLRDRIRIDIWFTGLFAVDKQISRNVFIKKFSSQDLDFNKNRLLSREIWFYRKTDPRFLDLFLPLTDILLPTTRTDSTKEISNIYMVYGYRMDLSLKGFLWWSKQGMTAYDLKKYLGSSYSKEKYLEIFKGLQEHRPQLLGNMNMNMNLHLKRPRKPLPLLTDDEVVKDILTQLLLLLLYLKCRQLVIRNINPDYLSININGDPNENLRFDLRMILLDSSFNVKSEYIQTRSRERKAMGGGTTLEEEIDAVIMGNYSHKSCCNYQSPELIMGTMALDYHPTDMWSVGCIFAELLGCPHILFNGDSTNGNMKKEQLNMITFIIGDPTVEEIDDIMIDRDRVDDKIFGWFRTIVARRFDEGDRRDPTPFSLLLSDANPLALDLLTEMVEFNPNTRITIEDALEHPYIKDFLGADPYLRGKYHDITSLRRVRNGGEGEEGRDGRNEDAEGEEEAKEIHDTELAERIFLREKFQFYNPKGILKGGLKGGFRGLKTLIARIECSCNKTL